MLFSPNLIYFAHNTNWQVIIHQSMPFLMPVLPTFCHNLVEGVEESRWVGVQLLVKTSPLQMVKSQP